MTNHWEELKRLIQEVRSSHRDDDSCDYNQCEDGECAWCEGTQKCIDALDAAEQRGSVKPICRCGTTLVCPDIGCDDNKLELYWPCSSLSGVLLSRYGWTA